LCSLLCHNNIDLSYQDEYHPPLHAHQGRLGQTYAGMVPLWGARCGWAERGAPRLGLAENGMVRLEPALKLTTQRASEGERKDAPEPLHRGIVVISLSAGADNMRVSELRMPDCSSRPPRMTR